MIFTPISLPDDNVFQKALNIIGETGNKFCRRNRVNQLEAVMKDVHKLYERYKGVFKQVNALLQELGRNPVDISSIICREITPNINNSLENDDWGFELEAYADTIRDFIETSCSKAEELIELLNQKESVGAMAANKSV